MAVCLINALSVLALLAGYFIVWKIKHEELVIRRV